MILGEAVSMAIGWMLGAGIMWCWFTWNDLLCTKEEWEARRRGVRRYFYTEDDE